MIRISYMKHFLIEILTVWVQPRWTHCDSGKSCTVSYYICTIIPYIIPNFLHTHIFQTSDGAMTPDTKCARCQRCFRRSGTRWQRKTVASLNQPDLHFTGRYLCSGCHYECHKLASTPKPLKRKLVSTPVKRSPFKVPGRTSLTPRNPKRPDRTAMRNAIQRSRYGPLLTAVLHSSNARAEVVKAMTIAIKKEVRYSLTYMW